MGDDWQAYAQRYQPKDKPTQKQQKRFLDFIKLVNRADDATFNQEIASYLDLDSFLRFLAVNAMVVNLDSFLGFGHNYYLYLRPDTDQFVFIPWDLDLAFGFFPMAGTGEQQADLSLSHPHTGDNKLIDRLLANKEANEKYQKILKEIAAKAFSAETLHKEIAAIESATKDALAREKVAVEARKENGGMRFGPGGGGPGGPSGGGGPGGPGMGGGGPGGPGGGPGGMFGQAMALDAFITKRIDSIANQFAGKSKGFVPQIGMGMFARFQPGQVLPGFFQDRLQLTAEQKKQVEELQKEVDARLGKILTEDQRKKMREMRQ
jgi:hypothetical protein